MSRRSWANHRWPWPRLGGRFPSGGNLTQFHSIGSVSGTARVGSLVGRNYDGGIAKSFWDTETSGRATSAGGTGKTTAEVCAAYDGQVYDLMDGPRPPEHYGCRCTTVPVCKSWKEMGFDLDEMPAGERAATNGRVPDKVTYGEWLKGQSRATQELALGKRKAQLFRSGRLSITDFIDNRGRILTLKKLESLI